MNLNSILIFSEDPAALAAYYTKLFGEPGWSDGDYRGWMLGSGFVTVGPHDQVHGRNLSPARIMWNIESADVAGDFARLRDSGAIVVAAPYSPGEMEGGLIATFADPDDNCFQLVSPMQVG